MRAPVPAATVLVPTATVPVTSTSTVTAASTDAVTEPLDRCKRRVTYSGPGTMSAKPSIAVHGGAGEHDPETLPACRAACADAARKGYALLEAGASCLDAVEAAVRALEDEPLFNAGVGAVLNAAGAIEVDASIMHGDDLRAGAVGALLNYRHPVTVARRILEEGRHVLLVGDGAAAFARSLGLFPESPDVLATPRALRRYLASLRAGAPLDEDAGNTVGAVARDLAGHVASATSTGGVSFKRPGRLGDTPLIGCGTYADDRLGAVSATGRGENIIRVVLARSIASELAAGVHPEEVARRALAELEARTGGRAGVIVVDRAGRIGVLRTTLHMPHAYIESGGDLVAGA